MKYQSVYHWFYLHAYWIWKSMRQVCSRSIWDMNIHDVESAADLPQTLHHTERVCGKSAASLRQTCRRLFIILKRVCGKSAASLRQVCGRPGRRLFIILKEYAASLRQTCRRLFIILKEYAASLRQVCGRPNLHVKKMTVCGRSAADLRQVCRRSMRQAHFFPMGNMTTGKIGQPNLVST